MLHQCHCLVEADIKLVLLFSKSPSLWHTLIISCLYALLIEAWINCCNLCYRFTYLYTACSVGRDCEMSESICECVCVMWREVHLHSALHNAAAFGVCVCVRAGGGACVFAAWWSSSLPPHTMILTAEQNIKTQTAHCKSFLQPSDPEIWIHNIQTPSPWYLCEKCCNLLI